MRRVCWDAMMLIYLLDGQPTYRDRVQYLLKTSYERRDVLLLSEVGLGEVMAGAGKSSIGTAAAIRKVIDEMGFEYLPFTLASVGTFSHLRSVHRVKTADAIHLACAATAGVDMFLTNDDKLLKLHVPGIQFMAPFFTSVL